MRSESGSTPASSSQKGSPNDYHLKTAQHDEIASIKDADFDDLQASSFEANHPKKNLGIFVVICLGWNICNSWAGVAVTMAVSLPSGGMVTVIYGILLTTFAYTCCVATLAELASCYPTAGGQYHWTSILAPKRLSRGLVSDYLASIVSIDLRTCKALTCCCTCYRD